MYLTNKLTNIGKNPADQVMRTVWQVKLILAIDLGNENGKLLFKFNDSGKGKIYYTISLH